MDGLLNLIKEHVFWIPYMLIFFGGLSYHVLTALLAHPVGIDMSWGATIKDLEDSNLFIEVPIIFKRFWKVLLLSIASIAAVIILQLPNVLPLQWQIQGFFIYWPLLLTAILHILYQKTDVVIHFTDLALSFTLLPRATAHAPLFPTAYLEFNQ